MTELPKVLILEQEWPPCNRLLDGAAQLQVGEPGRVYSEAELTTMVASIDALIITSQHCISRVVIEAAHSLRIIAKYGSKPGPDNVDLQAATEHGIAVCYTPGANSDSVAEHTVGLILDVLKQIHRTATALETGHWRDLRHLSHELLGKTVGIVGLGHVGRRVATKLSGFDVRLLGHDPYLTTNAFDELGIAAVTLDQLLRVSDIVSIHTNLTPSTIHLIGREQLRLCKPTACLVNTSRGALVDEEALIEALQKGWISVAALDVFEQEPPDPHNPLLRMPNVLVTPHFASCTEEAFEREARTAIEEVLRVLAGLEPRFLANPEVLARLCLRKEVTYTNAKMEPADSKTDAM